MVQVKSGEVFGLDVSINFSEDTSWLPISSYESK